MRPAAASIPPQEIWTVKYFSFLKSLIFSSRSASMARVGVCTLPTASFLKYFVVYALVAFMPTSQSAFARQTEASQISRYSFPSFRFVKPSRIAESSMELIHKRFTGRVLPDRSYTCLNISSPSRPASQALTTYSKSFLLSSFFKTASCAFLSFATVSFHSSGIMGKSENVHFAYRPS